MPLPESALIALPLLCLVIGCFFTVREIVVARREARGGVIRCKRCRYCMFGYARFTEERVRCEGNDLVQVRTFVCSGCGLPQWSIDRTPLVEKVS